MPFPLQTLPYGLRRRLRELSSAFEVRDLHAALGHIALGSNAAGFGSYPILRRAEHVVFDSKGVTDLRKEVYFCTYDENLDINPASLEILFCGLTSVTFDRVPADIFDKPVVKRLFLNAPYYLFIFTEMLTLPMLQNIFKHVDPVWEYIHVHPKKSQLTFKEVFSTIPPTVEVSINFVAKGWIKDLIDVDYACIREINIAPVPMPMADTYEEQMNALDILFDFEAADLFKLLETGKCKRYVILLNYCGVFYDTKLLKERILEKMSLFYHHFEDFPEGDFREIRFHVDSENFFFYLKPTIDADTVDQRQGCFSWFRQCFRRRGR